MSTSPHSINAPPFKTWFWVAALILGTGFCILRLPPANYEILAAFEERIEAFDDETGGSEETTVVLLGTSLLGRALPLSHEMRQLGDNRVQFLRLALNDARFDLYEPLLPRILELQPDAIVVHADVFLGYPNHRIRQARLSLKLALDGYFFGEPWSYTEPSEFTDCSGQQNAFELAAASELIERRFSEFSGVPRTAIRFLKQARAQGVQVILLDLPRSDLLPESILSLWRNWRKELSLALTSWPEVETWSWQATDDRRLFCDFTHMSPYGRQHFLEWFVPKILASTHEQDLGSTYRSGDR